MGYVSASKNMRGQWAAYEGIIAEIRRIKAQEPTGTRENGLRRILSSREDGSAACCE